MNALRFQGFISNSLVVSVSLLLLGLILAVGAGYLQGAGQFVPSLGLAGMVLAPGLLALPTSWLIACTVSLLLGSGLFVMVGFPGLVSYAHFGLFLVLLLRVLLFPPQLNRESAVVMKLAAAFAVAAVLSSLVGGWHGLRPFLYILVYLEPFVLFALVLSLDEGARRLIRLAVLGLAVVQIPFAILQFLQYGAGDEVKGALVNYGAGHHLLGGIGVIAAALWFSEFRKRGSTGLLVGAAGAAVLLGLGVISDAKQVFAALAVGGAFVLLRSGYKSIVRLFPFLIIGSLVVVVGAILNPAVTSLVDRSMVERNLALKVSYVEITADALSDGWWISGLGGGNGGSRVAMLSMPGYGNVPQVILGSEQAELAVRLDAADQWNWRHWGHNSGSSTSSPFNSLQGVLSDSGVVGVVLVLSIGYVMWRSASRYDDLERQIVQTPLLMTLGLGVLYTWWDEPAFGVYLAVALAAFPVANSSMHRVEDTAPMAWRRSGFEIEDRAVEDSREKDDRRCA